MQTSPPPDTKPPSKMSDTVKAAYIGAAALVIASLGAPTIQGLFTLLSTNSSNTGQATPVPTQAFSPTGTSTHSAVPGTLTPIITPTPSGVVGTPTPIITPTPSAQPETVFLFPISSALLITILIAAIIILTFAFFRHRRLSSLQDSPTRVALEIASSNHLFFYVFVGVLMSIIGSVLGLLIFNNFHLFGH